MPPGTALWLELPDGWRPSDPDASVAGAAPGAGLRGIVPGWPWTRGRHVAGAAVLDWEALEERDGLRELRFRGAPPAAVRAFAAAAGAPLLGDVGAGGIVVEGGLRLRVEGGSAPPGFWPEELVFPPDAASPGPDAHTGLPVSAATARALHRGHPWILADDDTGDAGAFAAGALVRVRAPDGAPLGLARVEGDGRLVARVWAVGASRPREAPSVEARVARALARRAPLRAAASDPSGTDALRLVHGEADGLPGLAVDRLGPLLRVLVTGRAALALRGRVLDAVVRGLAPELGPAPPVVEVLHLRRAPPGELCCVRALGEGDAPAELEVREGALRFRVETGVGEPLRARPGTGLFLDQRDNRARLAARARADGRYLNLFAHTGAFSAALLAAGAAEVTSVDLSAPYLAWLEDNLRRSALPLQRHRSIRGDARRWLETSPEAAGFDGIVLDPPTAAAAGRRFWSVRQGLERLVAACLVRLTPGGWLLLSSNDRRARGRLRARLQDAAGAAGVGLAAVEPAPPSPDFPSLPGFPEGDPFEAWLATREPQDARKMGS